MENYFVSRHWIKAYLGKKWTSFTVNLDNYKSNLVFVVVPLFGTWSEQNLKENVPRIIMKPEDSRKKSRTQDVAESIASQGHFTLITMFHV